MKPYFIFILSLLFLVSCKKETTINRVECNSLKTIGDWPVISFKYNYTIQVPDTFEGDGMVGFEGPVFYKNSADNKIKLYYSYCKPLWCDEFGDTLPNTIPGSIKVMGNFDIPVTLDKTAFFCKDEESMGILYYSINDITKGRLYWKDNGILKQALEVEFKLSELETVKKIIETIKN
jgi:hypothetical protein